NKGWVESAISTAISTGIKPGAISVRLATTEALLTLTVADGVGLPGGGASPPDELDGVPLQEGDLILVKDGLFRGVENPIDTTVNGVYEAVFSVEPNYTDVLELRRYAAMDDWEEVPGQIVV